MGCDIHVHLEGKLASGRWALLDMPLADGTKFGVDTDLNEVYRLRGERDRCYATFAALAGVRNEGNIAPISLPRGVPPDSPLFGTEDASEGDSDYHSHSWLTVREILAYDWKNTLPSWQGEPSFLNWVRDKVAPLGELDELRVVFWFDN